MADSHDSAVHDEYQQMFRTLVAANLVVVVSIPLLVLVTLLTCRG